MPKYKLLISLLFILPFLSCKKSEPVPGISVTAEAFLNELIEVMEEYSINRAQIDWTDFRTKVFNTAGYAQTIAQTYDAVRTAIGLLGDNHSFLITTGGQFISNSNVSCQSETFDQPTIPQDIGYILVPSFAGSEAEATAFAQDLQDQIQASDKDSLKGWIVDLRGNGGGNMWPMLAGVGPILGEGTVGHFVAPTGDATTWKYNNGVATHNDTPISQVAVPYELIIPNPKVAVLLDNAVASSGEAIAISFVGRANTKSFGSPTCGVSTSNSQFNISNGATLLLTTATMADRNLNSFGATVAPDEIVNKTEVILKAIEWLQQ